MDLNWQSLLTLACRDHSRRLVETNNPRGESAPLNMMPHPSDFYLFVPATPWGQTPVLEANGQTVTQSIAITRYLGRQAGLCGADAWEDMRIDEIVYVINDLRAELAKYHYEKDEKRKEEVKGTVLSTTAPFYLSRLDAHVKANNGYLANGKLSWADLYFAAISDYLSFMYGSDITAGYPNLTELREKVLALPKIKEWVSKRPVTNV
ncbi:hypothetical protein J6590_085458 [Homalodisca vitripennis]|nr:hypothetical protein J6590_085458 [Homalodisca vitripennis]